MCSHGNRPVMPLSPLACKMKSSFAREEPAGDLTDQNNSGTFDNLVAIRNALVVIVRDLIPAPFCLSGFLPSLYEHSCPFLSPLWLLFNKDSDNLSLMALGTKKKEFSYAADIKGEKIKVFYIA